MSEQAPDVISSPKPMDLGVYNRMPRARSIASADVIAFALTAVWLLGAGMYFLFVPTPAETSPGTFIVGLLAIVLPIALIWIGASVAKSTQVMREEAARLQAAIDGMRIAYVNQAQAAGMGVKPSVERKLDEIANQARKTQNTVSKFAEAQEEAERRPAIAAPAAVQPEPEVDSQPALALGAPTAAERPPLSMADFIGALNFPEDENDQDGFRQLRAALAEHESGKLVRAAQDVLTLLSQDGIYMDDLAPDRSRPEIWRKFANGERGQSISSLGGIHDRSSLALAAGRMRSDAVYRDAVHHFLRQFDKTLAQILPRATDEEISKLADTRTARAFMILGRATGTFD